MARGNAAISCRLRWVPAALTQPPSHPLHKSIVPIFFLVDPSDCEIRTDISEITSLDAVTCQMLYRSPRSSLFIRHPTLWYFRHENCTPPVTASWGRPT